MKYAIVVSGGKQYVAEEGGTIEVDKLPLEPGKAVTFDSVLLVVDNGKVSVGKPKVHGAKVKGKVLDQIKGPKIVVFKYKPKERYRRKQGHRQKYTKVSIEKITVSSTSKTGTKAESSAKSSKAESAKGSKKSATSKSKTKPEKG